MGRWLSLAIALAAACGGKDEDRPPAPPVTGEVDAATPSLGAPTPPPAPSGSEDDRYGAEVRSLRLERSIKVRLTPGSEGKQIGTVAQDTRVSWTRTEKSSGCKDVWVEMSPRGWVCGEYLEPLPRSASGVELPRLDRGEIVPGTYGRVIDEGAIVYSLGEGKAGAGGAAPAPAPGPVTSPDEVDAPPAAKGQTMTAGPPLLGSVTVRKYGEITVGGKAYWKVGRGNEYILRKSIYEHKPSELRGTRLGDDTGLQLPIAFVWPKVKSASKAWVRYNAKGAGAVREIEARTVVPVLETAQVGTKTTVRIGAEEWLRGEDVRIADVVEPPPLIGEHERWIDVDLDTQILVAYEGRLPVFATLVSTGKTTTPTETGVWRMWKKVSETDMKDLTGEDPYAVATVPWTQFFDPIKGLALHTAYWHDRFGTTRSHGCVNLSPADARWLYFWTDPQVPPGWTMTAGVLEAPGSLIRVRSKADPNPAFKGYGKKVQEEREARAAAL